MLHYLFELGVSLKFLDGVLEVVGGIVLFFSTPQSLGRLATILLTSELLEDPKDLVANTLMHAVQRLSTNAQVFAGIYLLVHGVVKVGLVIALWTKKLWAYPKRERPASGWPFALLAGSVALLVGGVFAWLKRKTAHMPAKISLGRGRPQ